MAEFTGTGETPSQAGAKLALRDQLTTARRRRPVLDQGRLARRLAEVVLAVPEVRRAATLAAYVSVSEEPGTGPLLEALRQAGRRVLLPVVLPDLDLDWAVHTGERDLVPARWGMLEPAGPRLGVEALAQADVVIVPALAAGRDGSRLGRGGGSYDRALPRVTPGSLVCALVHPEELLATVPTDPHDRRVHAVATADGLTRCRRA